jgi:hypothetical protein
VSYFAEIDENDIVIRVIKIQQEVLDTGLFGDPKNWIQTSYNTYGGVHRLGGTPLRKNYAGVGYKYDRIRDAFISPQPFPSWSLNEDSCLWEAPVPCPLDNNPYAWNEEEQKWEIDV